MKIISALMIFGLLIILFGNAYADDPHSSDFIPTKVINNYSVDSSQAMALAVSEINPTVVSSKWQMGIGFGSHNDETAIALGLAKRVNKTTLLSGKIANQGGDIGVSMGLNLKF